MLQIRQVAIVRAREAILTNDMTMVELKLSELVTVSNDNKKAISEAYMSKGNA
jgi:hypothetical protein